MNIYVIGGTGGIGAELVQAYKRENIPVTAISSSCGNKQDGPVQYVQCDMTDSAALSKIIQSNSLIFHCANVAYNKWITDLAPMMDGLLASIVGKKVHVVYLDNFYAYGDPKGPVFETNIYNPVSKKGKIRASLAEQFEEFVSQHDQQGTIVRAGDVYGANMKNAVFGNRTFAEIVKGKNPSFPVPVKYDHYFNPVDDVAKALKLVGEKTDLENPVFEIFHVPSNREISISRLVDYASESEGTHSEAKMMPNFIRSVLSILVPPLKEFEEMQYEFSKPVSALSTNFESHFEFVPTPHKQAVVDELAKFKSNDFHEATNGDLEQVEA